MLKLANLFLRQALYIVDISDKEDPWIVETFREVRYAYDVKVTDEYVYVGGNSGFYIINADDVNNLLIRGYLDVTAIGIELVGNHAYVSGSSSGVMVVDISTANDPKLLNYGPIGYSSSSVSVFDDYLYVADRENGFIIVEMAPVGWIESITPDPVSEFEIVHFQSGATFSRNILRYVWSSSIDGDISNGIDPTASITGLSQGNHTISFRVMDEFSLWSTPRFAELTVLDDGLTNTPPQVTVSSHDNGSTVGGTVNIIGECSDADGNETILSVEVSVDGGGWDTVIGTGSWSFLWDTSEIEFGDHTLQFRGYDGTDFSSVYSITVNVQNVSGGSGSFGLSISSHTNGTTVKGTIVISGTAADDRDIEHVEFRLSGSDEWTNVTGISSWSLTLDTTRYADGEYTLEFRTFNGTHYSDTQSLLVNIENEKKDGSNGNLLDEKIGPLPLVGIVLVAVIGSVFVVIKKRSESSSRYDWTLPPPAPPTMPAQSSGPLPPQQTAQGMPPPSTPSPSEPSHTLPSPSSPSQSTGIWSCPQCNGTVGEQYTFCMKCGYRRDT